MAASFATVILSWTRRGLSRSEVPEVVARAAPAARVAVDRAVVVEAAGAARQQHGDDGPGGETSGPFLGPCILNR